MKKQNNVREYEMAGGVRTRDRVRKANLTRLKATPAEPKNNPVNQSV